MIKGKISFRPVHNATVVEGIGQIEVLRNMKVVAVIHPTAEGIKIESRCLVRISGMGEKGWTVFNYDPRMRPTDVAIDIGRVVKRVQ